LTHNYSDYTVLRKLRNLKLPDQFKMTCYVPGITFEIFIFSIREFKADSLGVGVKETYERSDGGRKNRQGRQDKEFFKCGRKSHLQHEVFIKKTWVYMLEMWRVWAHKYELYPKVKR
jgi:hypothetical protein